MSDTVSLDRVAKSLEALTNIAKGHSSKGTVTTAVESMQGQGGATQVFHTPSNSDPGSWAGSVARDVPENGATDAIGADGTDYNGGAQMVKSILDKLAKGAPVTAQEYALVKSAMEKGFPFGDKDEKKDDKDDKKVEKAKDKDDDKDGNPFGKSLAAEDQDQISKGFEVSAFLESWSNGLVKSLADLETRLARRIDQRIAAFASDQGDFQKSLATALSDVGQTVVLTAQRMDQLEVAPARAPKAVQNVAFAKGGYGGEAPSASEDILSKALHGDFRSKEVVGDIIADLVIKGHADAMDAVRFNSNGTLSPILQKKVADALSGK